MADLDRLLAPFPRARLLPGPTPLEELPRLGARLGIDLAVKRDDLTGLAFGGNKVRKLEFYCGRALADGADTLLITGAVQSNYTRVTAACAARLGLACHVQLEERVPGMGPAYRTTGNVLVEDLLGAVRHSYPQGEDEDGADRALRALADDLKRQGKRPYVIPLAPSNPPLGSLGYVLAAREILGQRPALDAIAVGSGSGQTHAGLLFGLRLLGWTGRVIGVCVRRDASAQSARIAGHCAAIATLLGIANPVAPADVITRDDSLAPGYGRMSAPVADALGLAARLEGLLVEPVYTAKALAGLIARVAAGEIMPGSRVLFVHTGGLPALFAYESELRAATGA